MSVALAVLALLAVASSALAAAPKAPIATLGAATTGEAGGLFNAPRGVAINQTGAGGVAAGTFYVVDSGNRRIQRFGPGGDFVSAWGWKVNLGNSGFGICVEAAKCERGSAGPNPGQLGNNGGQGIAVSGSTGHVFVSDQASNNRRIDVFSAAGAFEGAFGWGVRNGEPKFQFCTVLSGCGGAQISPPGGAPPGPCGMFGTAVGGLAVDAAGDVYVANRAFRRVDVFRPTLSAGVVTGVECLRVFGWDVVAQGPDETVTDGFEVCSVAANPTNVCQEGTAGPGPGQFAAGSPVDVAVDSGGRVLALDNNVVRRVQRFSSGPAPLDASFAATPLDAVFGAGERLGVAVDPSTDHVFVSGKREAEASYVAVVEVDQAGGGAVTHGSSLPANAGATSTGFTGVAVSKASLGGNAYVTVATTGTLQGVYILNSVPTIEPVTAFDGTSALLEGKVVSDGIPVSYRFEYSTDGKKWVRAPTVDLSAGAAPAEIAVGVELTGLTGSQAYRARLVQSRGAAGGFATSAETTFTTPAAKPSVVGTVASPVRDTGATLNAYLDPQNAPTSYRFEYGRSDCAVAGCAALPVSVAAGGGPRLVAQSVAGLQPATRYHYRLVATNTTGTTESADRTFETFPAGRKMPDGRAYELVTPSDTGTVAFAGSGFGEVDGRGCFDFFPATSDGNGLLSLSKGGSVAGLTTNGNWDLYESVRAPDGWVTTSRSPTGAESAYPAAGGGLCASPDHRHSTLTTGSPPADEGSLVVDGKSTSYVRGPTGSFTLVGQGELGTDPEADVRWLTADPVHMIFTSERRLEPTAPPSGTEAVYDRTGDGAVDVISLLPGGAPLAGGEDAEYQGASRDGAAIAFKVGGNLYVRVDGETMEVAALPCTFAGVSVDGAKVFYADAPPTGGHTPAPAGLYAFDTRDGTAEEIAGAAVFVNVADDGSRVYFTSTAALTGSERNSLGREAEGGKNNLYVWDGASETIRFVAVLSAGDLEGSISLARWTTAAVLPRPTVLTGRANSSSRTTPSGSVLLFESRARITPYDSGGSVEIYRYEAGSGALDCVSCPPLGAAAGDARLRAPDGPTSSLVHVQNVSEDGSRVFFQTEDALVPGDVNETWDVYEWKAGQQAYLISSGQGRLPSFLYGMSPSGDDVFFTSTERLVGQDVSTVSSIYDARVGGGFPEAVAPVPCWEDACQGGPAAAPPLSSPGSAGFVAPGDPKPRRHGARKHKKKQKHEKRRRVGRGERAAR
ncbi:MAG TPA: hypothetical protein VGO66_00920 [Solirubrobacterales bacterium]|nr:hypothetical protein [Solirubrobacterales bacterium]